VWLIPLDMQDRMVVQLAKILSRDEREQSSQLRKGSVRKNFIVARGYLRRILACYVKVRPETIVFDFNENGKPELPKNSPEEIFFNLSHTDMTAVCAVARRPVGIDIEFAGKEWPHEQFREFLSAPEFKTLSMLPQAERNRAFLKVWVRKEAYLKAKGTGLHYPLASFDVSISPDHSGLIAHRLEPDDVGRWSFTEIDAGPCCLGAVAAQGKSSEVRYRVLEELPE